MLPASSNLGKPTASGSRFGGGIFLGTPGTYGIGSIAGNGIDSGTALQLPAVSVTPSGVFGLASSSGGGATGSDFDSGDQNNNTDYFSAGDSTAGRALVNAWRITHRQ